MTFIYDKIPLFPEKLQDFKLDKRSWVEKARF